MSNNDKIYCLAITVPGCPENLNTMLRMNWRVLAKKKKEWHEIIWYLCRGKQPPTPLEKFKLTFIRKSYRSLDFDGLVGSFKCLADGLILAKIIKNDTYAMSGAWDCSQEYVPKKKGQSIEIYVEERD